MKTFDIFDILPKILRGGFSFFILFTFICGASSSFFLFTKEVRAATSACVGGTCTPGICGTGTVANGTCVSGTTCCMPTPTTGSCAGGTCVPGSCGAGTIANGTCSSGTTCCVPGAIIGNNTCTGLCTFGACGGGTAEDQNGTCSNNLQTCCVASPPIAPGAGVGPTETGGLVPCGTQIIQPGGDYKAAAEDCKFEDLIILAKNIINFLLFVIAVPIAAISFAWAGWLYLSAMGNESKVQEAHKIFGYVVMGLCFALAAWLIVNALVVGLGVGAKYNFLGTGGG